MKKTLVLLMSVISVQAYAKDSVVCLGKDSAVNGKTNYSMIVGIFNDQNNTLRGTEVTSFGQDRNLRQQALLKCNEALKANACSDPSSGEGIVGNGIVHHYTTVTLSLADGSKKVFDSRDFSLDTPARRCYDALIEIAQNSTSSERGIAHNRSVQNHLASDAFARSLNGNANKN